MIQKWKLLSKEDISPSPHFLLEKRTYELPDGKIIDDFYVTTVEDVALIIPITKDGKLVLVRQYKPGIDEITIEFPAGRLEQKHANIKDVAKQELEEETGIQTDDLELFAEYSGFPTKGTERVYCYLARNVEFNSSQKLDPIETIEILTFTPKEFDQLIAEGKIIYAGTIAAWVIAKQKFAQLFS